MEEMGHEITEIPDTGDRGERTEACLLCGRRRTVTERNCGKIEGPWEFFRPSFTPDPHPGWEPIL